jgi:uncharacterized protein (TIGR00369 family)
MVRQTPPGFIDHRPVLEAVRNSCRKEIDMDELLLRNLILKTEDHPYHRFIGVKVEKAGEGICRIRFSPSKNTLNLAGVVHGGIYYTVLDMAAFLASSSLVSNDQLTVTSDINVSVMRAVAAGDMTAEAKVLKMGGRSCFIDSRIFDKDGNMVAIGRVTKAILPFPKMKEMLA